MKPRPRSEVDGLRAEVETLRALMLDLETRLDDLEGVCDGRWNIWPYSWVVGGLGKTWGGWRKCRAAKSRALRAPSSCPNRSSLSRASTETPSERADGGDWRGNGANGLHLI